MERVGRSRAARLPERRDRGDRGEFVTIAGLYVIGTITMAAVGLIYNGGGAYVDNEKLGLAEEGYATSIGAMRDQRDYFDRQAKDLKAKGDLDEAEKWERASADVGTQLTYTYEMEKDTTARIRNERDAKALRAAVSVVPGAAPLAAEAKFLSTSLTVMTAIGTVQADQDRRVAEGGEPPEPAKLSAAGRETAVNRRILKLYPGRDPKLVAGMAGFVATDIDSEVELMPSVPTEVEIEEGAFMDALDRRMEWIDPTQKTSAADNSLVLTPEQKAALENGEKERTFGLYKGAQGLEPVIVTRDDASGDLDASFQLYKGTPNVEFTPKLTQKDEVMQPSWWDGSRPSCPYLYAFDGSGFAAVNDIISVSRDPSREYDDRLLFSAEGRAGVLELRVAEVRGEESFVDALSLTAVDLEPGFAAAVTPEGRVLSVGASRAPARVAGAAAAAVAYADGFGAKAFDGDAIEAEWPVADGSPAVLMLTIDGFEADGAEGAPTGERPAVSVEVWRGGAWRATSTVYPKGQPDAMAVDLTGMAEGGRLRVRLVVASCHERKYQLLDRVALSTARTDAVSVRSVPFASAELGGRDVRAGLASADGMRVHTVPGDVLYLKCADPGADRYVLTARGWYRAYAR